MGFFTVDIIILMSISVVLLLITVYSCVRNVRSGKAFDAQKSLVPLTVSKTLSVLFVCIVAVIALLTWLLPGGIWVKIFLTFSLLCGAASMLLLQLSVSGVTEEGLFVCGRLIEWHNIYDFYMNKKQRTVIFSNNIKGGLTLKGLTVPMKYDAGDEQTLEAFIMKYHNKSRTRIIIR